MTGARRLIALGGLLVIPAAIGAGIFAYGWADADALGSASVCAHPDRSSSSCLSLFDGTIVRRNPGSAKAAASYTIAAAGTTTDIVPSCFQSRGACGGFAFQTGAPVATGWWKGGLVLIGPPQQRPRIVTDASPENHLGIEAYLLALVIPTVSLLLAGILRRRRRDTINELFFSSLARSPDPPRPVDHGLVQRVAWSNYTYPLPVAWALVYFVPAALMGFGFIEPRLAPLMLAAGFVIAVALVAWVTDSYFSDLIRTAARRQIEVKSVAIGGRNAVPTVSYQLLSGDTTTYSLGEDWKGHVKPGDRIDALTNRKSGSIRRVISAPAAQE
jgi:hypothetical protein